MLLEGKWCMIRSTFYVRRGWHAVFSFVWRPIQANAELLMLAVVLWWQAKERSLIGWRSSGYGTCCHFCHGMIVHFGCEHDIADWVWCLYYFSLAVAKWCKKCARPWLAHVEGVCPTTWRWTFYFFKLGYQHQPTPTNTNTDHNHTIAIANIVR